jgi:hypothetical protein
VDLEARTLCIELRELFFIERNFDDTAAPKPDVDTKKLVELVRELGVELSASPSKLKRQRVLERLDRRTENSSRRR